MKTSLNRCGSIGVVLASMGTYFFAAMVLYPKTGPAVLALSFIPPAIAGWLLGTRGGLLCGILAFPVTGALLRLAGDTTGVSSLGAALMGGSCVTLIGMAIGWIRGLLDRLKDQAVQLEKERTLLRDEVRRRMEAEERLIHEARHDLLTDLPNRRLFVDRLEHALARSRRNLDARSALLYIDLNRFKSINDSLGHDAGDRLLIQVAGRLKSVVRASDTVARIGGDEFAVLLEAVSNPEEVTAIVQRIQAALALPYEWNGKSFSTGASIGVVMNLTIYGQVDDVMRDADVAMYRAKADGGNEFRVCGDERPEQIDGPSPRRTGPVLGDALPLTPDD
jgi:diguanylate cyclase (GGDEF)-like protein